jgi:proliferating cell nuclear antigen
MPCLFKAKTQEGYIIKILGELLQHIIKTGCFVIDKNGIKLRMMDSHRKKLVDIQLDASKFSIYKFKSEKKFLGLNLSYFYKMLKSIKKKDSIVLFINDDKEDMLGIKVIPPENNRITISYIKIQSIQNLDIELPTGYNHSIIVQSSEYQKMCKDMANISTYINIYAKKFHIKFSGNASSIYSRNVMFGEIDDSDSEDEDCKIVSEFNDDFETAQLSSIIKIAGLNNTMQIFPQTNLPLLFKTNIGNLGVLQLFLKSKKQIDHDELPND